MITARSRTARRQPRGWHTAKHKPQHKQPASKMVVLVLVSVGMVLPGATEAFNCCFRPPNISALGPPPRPPGINFDLRCNGSGGVEKVPYLPDPSLYTQVAGRATQWPPSSQTKGPMISSTTGQGGLGGGELAAVGLGLLLVIAILCILALYWKKRYKPSADGSPRPRVNPTPVKEETNYLYNYRMRGWNWRPGSSSRGHHDDIERPDDKKALITSPVTSHMSLSSGSMDAGYGGDPRCADDGDHTPALLKAENSMSSGIGLSQGDLQEEEDEDAAEDYATIPGAGTVQLMNGDSGFSERSSREMKARYVHRSTSNPGMAHKANHTGPYMAKSLSSHNRLDNGAESIVPSVHHLQNGRTGPVRGHGRGGQAGTLPILEPIRFSKGPDPGVIRMQARPDFDPYSLPSGKPRSGFKHDNGGARTSRLEPLQTHDSPDSARSKKKKKKRKTSSANGLSQADTADTVAMDTIPPTSLSLLPPISGNTPRLKEPPKNGESRT